MYPLVMSRVGRARLQPTIGRPPHPGLDAVLFHQVVVVEVGLHAAELVGRRARGDRVQALGELIGELQRDGAADRLADQVRLGDLEVIHEVDQVGREALERPRVAGWRHGRPAEASGIETDHPELAGEQRHPRVPEARVLGVAVMQDDGLRRRPGIGEAVVLVVHDQISGQARRRHDHGGMYHVASR
jgi:hypothetical protein